MIFKIIAISTGYSSPIAQFSFVKEMYLLLLAFYLSSSYVHVFGCYVVIIKQMIILVKENYADRLFQV